MMGAAWPVAMALKGKPHAAGRQADKLAGRLARLAAGREAAVLVSGPPRSSRSRRSLFVAVAEAERLRRTSVADASDPGL